jgi:hypothetical protein
MGQEPDGKGWTEILAGIGCLGILAVIGFSVTAFKIAGAVFWTVILLIVLAVAALAAILFAHWRYAVLTTTAAAAFVTERTFVEGRPGIAAVVLCSAMWTAAVFMWRRSLKEENAAARTGLKVVLQVCCTFLVTGVAVWLLSVVGWPPTVVQKWARSVAAMREVLSKVALSTGLSLAIVVTIVLARPALPGWAARILEALWTIWARGKPWIKRCTLATTVVCSFSYTAITPSGLLDRVAREVEILDRQYADLVWRVELDLSMKVGVRILEHLIGELPKEDRDRIIEENRLVNEARIPERQWLRILVTHTNLKESREQRSRWIREESRKEENRIRQQRGRIEAPDDSSMAKVRRGMEAAESPRPGPLPEWLQGFNEELLKAILAHASSLDNSVFMQMLKDSQPMVAELVKAVLEAAQSAQREMVKAAAREIANESIGKAAEEITPKMRAKADQAAQAARVPVPGAEALSAARKASEERARSLVEDRARLEEQLIESAWIVARTQPGYKLAPDFDRRYEEAKNTKDPRERLKRLRRVSGMLARPDVAKPPSPFSLSSPRPPIAKPPPFKPKPRAPR